MAFQDKFTGPLFTEPLTPAEPQHNCDQCPGELITYNDETFRVCTPDCQGPA